MDEIQTIVRKAGRPRKIKEDFQVAQEQEVKIVSTISEVKFSDNGQEKRILGIRGGKEIIIPYRGQDKLNKKENHYFINGNPSSGYKLIRVYLDQFGKPKRCLEKTLKPNKRTIRGENDRRILKELKIAGVSGIL
jgi:hypothetical protein